MVNIYADINLFVRKKDSKSYVFFKFSQKIKLDCLETSLVYNSSKSA